MKRRTGSVLVQVLMTAVIVSIIAAGMMQILLMRAQSIKRDEQRISGTAKTHLYYNAIMREWSERGIQCYQGTNIGGVTGLNGGNQTVAPGACACTYTTPDGATLTSVSSSGLSCALTIPAQPLD